MLFARTLCLAAAALSLSSPAPASIEPVDINGVGNCGGTGKNGVPVTLAAGRHVMRPVSRAYTAWNAWGGSVSGCDGSGGNCSTGWIVQWAVYLEDGTILSFPGTFVIWQTPELALAHASSFELVLNTAQTVYFGIRDFPCNDNAGGISLDVSSCTADFNADGTVNSTDVSDFINQWFADQIDGTLLTDWDDNGVVNSTDVSDFINAWFADTAAGCP